jgi:hypothetical protein
MNLIDRMFPKIPAAGGDGSTVAAPVSAPTAATAPAPITTPGTEHVTAGSRPIPNSELAQRRKVLQERFAQLQWNLGGVAYEMAIRDHFRLDVLVRLSAELQQVDAELGEVERLLRLEEGGAAGACPSCDALYGRGAVYCWQCGSSLMPHATVTGAPVGS